MSYDIPTRVIKESGDLFSEGLCNNFTNFIVSSSFPQCLQLADIKPLHKKGKKNLKKIFKPAGILPNVLKIYEKNMFTQMNKFFQTIFSRCQCGFRKAFSAQQCLLQSLS